MPRALHIVTTAGFAGVERYVCDVSAATARRGWEVAVVGGDRGRMASALDDRVHWEPGATLIESARSVHRLGTSDICHAHMTAAETVAVATAWRHRAPIVSTRHFAARRGNSRLGRFGAPLIGPRITREIAISEFVAASIERAPDVVLVSGVRDAPLLWRPQSRVVAMLQRLEAEKDTMTALRAWQAAAMTDDGWTLEIYGEGSERGELERWVAGQRVPGVTFAGWTNDVASALARAGVLLAPALAEPLGLSVLDAMAAGVPVVAAASGGHLETAGLLERAPLFAPADAAGAAQALRSMLADVERLRLSEAGRRLVATRFGIERHVDRLLEEYGTARGTPPRHHEPGVVERV